MCFVPRFARLRDEGWTSWGVQRLKIKTRLKEDTPAYTHDIRPPPQLLFMRRTPSRRTSRKLKSLFALIRIRDRKNRARISGSILVDVDYFSTVDFLILRPYTLRGFDWTCSAYRRMERTSSQFHRKRALGFNQISLLRIWGNSSLTSAAPRCINSERECGKIHRVALSSMIILLGWKYPGMECCRLELASSENFTHFRFWNTLIKKFKGSFRSFAVIFERKVTERWKSAWT